MASTARDGNSSPYIGKVITAFEGAITTRIIAHPHRAFAFEVTFELQHPRLVAVASEKPPMHFHPYQEEYVQVIEGRLGVDIEGRELLLGPEDGEFCIRPWANHRLCPPSPVEATGFPTTKFILSGQETEQAYRLDTVFFENWYAYQDKIVIGGQKVDLLQVMSIFDAGGSYLSFPWWVPFGRNVSRGLGIVMGRWVGAMLGYQPFHRGWTTDWQLACEKMETSVFQKKFSDRRKTE